jgi:acyl dehydratase
MWDTALIGKEYAPFNAGVDASQIAAFAAAIGEGDPIYRDEAAARAAGFPAIPAPLTFPFSLMMVSEQSFLVHADLDIPIPKTVHGEQWFDFHNNLYAGDVVTGQQKIADMFEKKGGALQFIITETRMDNQDGVHICDLKTSIVVLNG